MTIFRAIFILVASGVCALAMNAWLGADNFWFRWATILSSTIIFGLIGDLVSALRKHK